MSFGTNLQFLRKLRGGMTQEELAERLEVSRQTVSRWELDGAYPEMGKALELCALFACSMDELFRGEMDACRGPYRDIRLEMVEPFRYAPYTVLSREPEDDAISHVRRWALERGEERPCIIGWDFPHLSQEQVNVFHMHGYTAAWVLPEEPVEGEDALEVRRQDRQRYAAITIQDPMTEPFRTIPNAYKTLMAYMRVNGLVQRLDGAALGCYEHEYERDGEWFMDVYIAVK